MGPGASIILNYIPNDKEKEELFNEIGKFDRISPWSESFHVLGDEDDYEYTKEEFEKIKDLTGFEIESYISISTSVNSHREEHQNLGKAVLAGAIKAGGMIDFGGSILLPSFIPYKMFERLYFWLKGVNYFREVEMKRSWSEVEPYFEKMVSEIDGKIYTIVYEIANGRDWGYHICDTEFMKNWLNHPGFHMVK